MSTVQILKNARALIADEKNWAQKANARDEDGIEVRVGSDRAYSFCVIGALFRASDMDGAKDAREVIRDAISEITGGDRSITRFNDNRAHADVLIAFDRAIARAESEAA